jgi:hypothetical protein
VLAARHAPGAIIPVLVAGLPDDEAARKGRLAERAFPPALTAAVPGAPSASDFPIAA